MTMNYSIKNYDKNYNNKLHGIKKIRKLINI